MDVTELSGRREAGADLGGSPPTSTKGRARGSAPGGARRQPVHVTMAALAVGLALTGCGVDQATPTMPSGEATPTMPSGEVLLDERFSGDAPAFSEDVDKHVELAVVDEAYRILVKDRSPHVIRSYFSPAVDGVRFEATLTHVTNYPGLFALGCWSGDRAYLAVVTADRYLALLETVDESTGERRTLRDLTRSFAINPAGTANRIRIDCLAEGPEAGAVSAYVNETPIARVQVPGGIESFDAVGFYVLSVMSGSEFRVDDVLAVAERPPMPDVSPPSGSPPPPTGQEQVWFERDGLRFAYPADWIFYRRHEAVNAGWALSVGPDSSGGNDRIFVGVVPQRTPPGMGADRLELWARRFIRQQAAAESGVVLDGPRAVRLGGLSGFKASVGQMVNRHGQELSGEIVTLFEGETLYLLSVQYEGEAAPGLMAAWRTALSTFQKR